MSDPILAWHFCADNRRLGYGDGRLIVPGETLSVEPPVTLCLRGLHASVRALDALSHSDETNICRVELSGKIIGNHDEKVAQHRKTLWIADASRALHLFACDVADQAVELAIKYAQPLQSLGILNATIAKRRWLDGKCSDEELEEINARALKVVDGDVGVEGLRYRWFSAARADWMATGIDPNVAAWGAAWNAANAMTGINPGGVDASLPDSTHRTAWDELAADFERRMLALEPKGAT